MPFILCFKCRTRKFYRRIARNRRRLSQPGAHLAAESNIAGRSGSAQKEVGRELSVLRDAVVPAEEVSRHVQPSKLHVLGTAVEHVGETAIRPEHLRVRSGEFRDEIEHDVAFRAAHLREAHPGESAQILPGYGPGPLSLNAVHDLDSVHEESTSQAARRIKTR